MKLSKKILLTLFTGAITVYFNHSKSFADIPSGDTYTGDGGSVFSDTTAPAPSGDVCSPNASQADGLTSRSQDQAAAANAAAANNTTTASVADSG